MCLAEGETLLPKVQATLRDSWRPLLGCGLCAAQVRLILRVMQSHATSSCVLFKCRGLHQVLRIIYSGWKSGDFSLQGPQKLWIMLSQLWYKIVRRTSKYHRFWWGDLNFQSKSCFQLMPLVDSAHSLYLKINQIDDAVREAFYTFKPKLVFPF